MGLFVSVVKMKLADAWLGKYRLINYCNLCVFLISFWVSEAFCETPQIIARPFASLTQRFSDNFNLSVDKLSVNSTIFSTGLSSDISTSQWQTGITGRYTGEQFYGHSELDRNEGLVNLNSKITDEYTEFSINGGISFEQPSSSELGSGGVQFNRIDQMVWDAGTTLRLLLSNQFVLDLNYNYSETTFDGLVDTSRSDFSNHAASATLGFSQSASLQWFNQLAFFHTDIPGNNFKSDQVSWTIGFSKAYSNTLNFTLSAGGVMLLSESGSSPCQVFFNGVCVLFGPLQTSKDEQFGFIYSAFIEKQFEHTEISANLSRNLSPTFNGGQTELNQFELNVTHNLTDTLQLSLSGRAINSKTLENTFSQAGRQRYGSSTSLRWKFSKNLSLSSSYGYTYEDRDSSAKPAERNQIFFALKYDFSPQLIYP